MAVQAARVYGRRESGGRVELLFLDDLGEEREWYRCLMGARRSPRVGEFLHLDEGDGGVYLEVGARVGDGRLVRFFGVKGCELLARFGEMPLPPYILKRRAAMGRSRVEAYDGERYQTVYAREGAAVAAPTAGLHFTEALLSELGSKGVACASLRLDVGPGTFQPVRVERVEGHVMHSERYWISPQLVSAVSDLRARGGRLLAVGTTVVRALEDQFRRFGGLEAGVFDTALFIRPGYRFGMVDLMLTNFHLPASTLLMLVCAFGGYERVMAAYAHAVAQGYRFFSYGDAMLLLPGEAV